VGVTYCSFIYIGLSPKILINVRQVLFSAFTPLATDAVDIFSIIQSIDKLDKIPETAVIQELVGKGLSAENAEKCISVIKDEPPTKNLLEIISYFKALGVDENDYRFNPYLARGLDYYTNMIFEITLPEYAAGSLGGGGRYDKLIQQLGGPDIPAVGIAFGFDRKVDAALQLDLIPNISSPSTVLIASIDIKNTEYMLSIAAKLRGEKINTEVYPEIDKPGKILSYANKRQYPYTVIIGPEEKDKDVITLKNMGTGDQTTNTIEAIVSILKS